MDQAQPRQETTSGQVVSFDEALLDACPSELRAELIGEASLLIQAFAPEGRRDEVEAMARTLSSGGRDADMDRERARRLAAALRHVAGHGDPRG